MEEACDGHDRRKLRVVFLEGNLSGGSDHFLGLVCLIFQRLTLVYSEPASFPPPS